LSNLNRFLKLLHCSKAH